MRISKSPTILLDGYDASTDGYSDALSLKHMIGCSITASFVGGSPVGSISLQASNDGDDPITWVTITAPVTSVKTVSGAGNHAWNISNAFYRWIRVYYDRDSGSSTLTIKAYAKGV